MVEMKDGDTIYVLYSMAFPARGRVYKGLFVRKGVGRAVVVVLTDLIGEYGKPLISADPELGVQRPISPSMIYSSVLAIKKRVARWEFRDYAAPR